MVRAQWEGALLDRSACFFERTGGGESLGEGLSGAKSSVGSDNSGGCTWSKLSDEGDNVEESSVQEGGSSDQNPSITRQQTKQIVTEEPWQQGR